MAIDIFKGKKNEALGVKEAHQNFAPTSNSIYICPSNQSLQAQFLIEFNNQVFTFLFFLNIY